MINLRQIIPIVLLTACVQNEEQAATSQALKDFFDDGELWVAGQATGIERIFDEEAQPDGNLDLVNAGPHITTFPPSQDFAYIGGMLDGKLYVVDANTQAVVTTLQLGPTLVHQARPSPDGSFLFVTVLPTKTVVKVAANESARTWTVVGSLSTEATGKPPICTVFNASGTRAFVSLNPNGIAVVDVATMTIVNQLPTDGFVACGMIRSADGSHASVAASGSGGHIYTLDLANETLTDRGTVGAPSWHSWITNTNETLGVGTSPLSDDIVIVDLRTPTVTNLGSVHFDTIPGAGNDQPDAVGGGEHFDKIIPVSLRAAGKIALVDVELDNGVLDTDVEKIIDIAPPSTFNPATCQGCAVHGVTVRQLGN